MFTRSILSFFLLINVLFYHVGSVSLGDTVSSLQQGTLRLSADDQWVLDSSEESSNEDQRVAYLKQLKTVGRLHHRKGGLPE